MTPPDHARPETAATMHVINQELLQRSLLFCRFSLAAYSSQDPRHISGLHTGQLTRDIRLPRGYESNPTDTQVLVCNWRRALPKDSVDDVVVAFRGTELKWQDLLTDLKGSLEPCQSGRGKVHKGFQTALNSVYPAILKFIRDITTPRKSRLYVCGHSLGGALSLLFADRYVRRFAEPDPSLPQLAEVFTFGAPRVGDAAFAEAYRNSAAGASTSSWVDQEDPVTHVGPVTMGYRHATKEQLTIDKFGWVRRTNIDRLSEQEEEQQNPIDRWIGVIDQLRSASKLEARSHKLEPSYLNQLLIALKK